MKSVKAIIVLLLCIAQTILACPANKVSHFVYKHGTPKNKSDCEAIHNKSLDNPKTGETHTWNKCDYTLMSGKQYECCCTETKVKTKKHLKHRRH